MKKLGGLVLIVLGFFLLLAFQSNQFLMILSIIVIIGGLVVTWNAEKK